MERTVWGVHCGCVLVEVGVRRPEVGLGEVLVSGASWRGSGGLKGSVCVSEGVMVAEAFVGMGRDEG